MKIIVLGALGMLGRALKEELAGKHDADCFDLCDFDLTDDLAVKKALDLARPDAVVNCAAYTAVDQAESEPEKAMEINGRAPGRIAALCREREIRFVHISTDYVFDGTKQGAYLEDDPTGPQSVYGRTKLAGELAVREAHPDGHLILRTSWLFGLTGKCFPRTMLELYASGRRDLRVVADQHGRPTYTHHLARIIRLSLEKNLSGLYHACGKPEITWFEFSRLTFQYAKITDVNVTPVATSEFKTAAMRPLNSVLDSRKLEKALGQRMPDWSDGLALLVKSMGYPRETDFPEESTKLIIKH